jgi:hypothetical protein
MVSECALMKQMAIISAVMFAVISGAKAMIHHRIAEELHTTLEFDLVEPPPEEFRAAGAEVVLFVPGCE